MRSEIDDKRFMFYINREGVHQRVYSRYTILSMVNNGMSEKIRVYNKR